MQQKCTAKCSEAPRVGFDEVFGEWSYGPAFSTQLPTGNADSGRVQDADVA
jgi:hypothetical protein